MVVGTTSHAGKSLVTAALSHSVTAWLVAPSKGNMALNAYVTPVVGRLVTGCASNGWYRPLVEMNPILLKPQGDMTSR